MDAARVQHEAPAPLRLDMSLLDHEKAWVKDLISYAKGPGGDGLTGFTDLEYVSFALFSRGNLDDAVQRMRCTQEFKRMYRIQDTVEEGLAVLQEHFQTQPGVLLYVDSLGVCGGVIAWNWSAFFPARALESEAIFRQNQVAMYYLLHAVQPTIKLMREGISHLVQGSMGWDNFDSTMLSRQFAEFWGVYPAWCKHIFVYNTNSVANMAFALLKSMMPLQMRRSIALGCQVDFENPQLTLADLYFQPTYESAMKKNMERLRNMMLLRYYHQENYVFSATE
jgi:hypothetical protein